MAWRCRQKKERHGIPKEDRNPLLLSPLTMRRGYLPSGKHQGQARPLTGRHAPELPPTGGDPTLLRSPLRRSLLESLSLIAEFSLKLGLEVRPSFALVRVFPFREGARPSSRNTFNLVSCRSFPVMSLYSSHPVKRRLASGKTPGETHASNLRPAWTCPRLRSAAWLHPLLDRTDPPPAGP